MTVENPVRTLVLRYSGILDVEDLFNFIRNWLKARRFWWEEKTYKHKPGTEFGRELEIYWSATRKLDAFHLQRLDFEFHLWNLQDVEVAKEGKKGIMQHARVEIWFKGAAIYDYQNRWGKTRFHKALRTFYLRYIMRPDHMMSPAWDELLYRMYKILDLVKGRLNMQARGYEYKRYVGDNIP